MGAGLDDGVIAILGRELDGVEVLGELGFGVGRAEGWVKVFLRHVCDLMLAWTVEDKMD